MVLEYEIQYDSEYKEELDAKIRARFGSSKSRPATHVSDLLTCLRKAWAKKRFEQQGVEAEDVTIKTLTTWMGGLQFEDFVTDGEQQVPITYCFTCKAVSRQLTEEESATCPVCGDRWLIGTPDSIKDGIPTEVKQTRKSQRRGPEDAPWWAEQLASYLLFANKAGWSKSDWARLTVNWLMGDYGSRKKGEQPRPPQSDVDPFKVVFKGEWKLEWEAELKRRKEIVEGEEMPDLSAENPLGDNRAPAYSWECSSCPVGLDLDGEGTRCESFIWTEDGQEVGIRDEVRAEESN